MAWLCSCPVGDRWRSFWRRQIRAITLVFVLWLVVIPSILLIGYLGLISWDARSWLVLATVLAGMFLWLVTSVDSRPAPHWRSLVTSDLISVAGFAGLTAVGSWQLMRTEYEGMKLSWIVSGFLTVICVLAYEVILRIPRRINNFMQHMLAGPATTEVLRIQRDHVTHLRRCKARNVPKRLMKLNSASRQAAARRKGLRSANTGSHRLLRFVVRLLHPYTNISNWLAAYMVSASMFNALFSELPPSLLGGLAFFGPFVLVALIDKLRERLAQTPS